MKMVSLRGGGLASMWATLDRMVRSDEHTRAFYLPSLRRLMYKSFPAHADDDDGGEWAEIEDADDLEFVRRLRSDG